MAERSKFLDNITAYYLFAAVLLEALCQYPELRYISNAVSTGMIVPFILYVFLLKKKTLLDTNNLLYAIMCAYLIVTSAWHPGRGFIDFDFIQPYIYTPIRMIIFWNLLNWSNGAKPVIMAFFVVVAINTFLYVFSDIQSIGEYETFSGNRFTGTFSNSNSLALTVNLAMFFSIFFISRKERFRALWYLLLISGTILTIATASLKGIVLLGIIWGLFFLRTARATALFSSFKRIAFIVPVILFSFYFLWDRWEIGERWEVVTERMENADQAIGNDYADRNTSAGERKFFINWGLAHFPENPLWGHGVKSFQYYHDGTYSHNTPIELLFNGGLIAFVLYYLRFLLAFIACWNFRGFERLLFFVFLCSILLAEMAAILFIQKEFLVALMLIFYLSNKARQKREEAEQLHSATAMENNP